MKNVSVSSPTPSTLLSTSHTGQKKDPGEHRNKEEADRGREAEAPVHKGARFGFDGKDLRREANCQGGVALL